MTAVLTLDRVLAAQHRLAEFTAALWADGWGILDLFNDFFCDGDRPVLVEPSFIDALDQCLPLLAVLVENVEVEVRFGRNCCR